MQLEGHLKKLDMWKAGKTMQGTEGGDYDADKDVMLHILKELTDINGKLGGVAKDLDEIRANQGRS